MIFPIKKYLVCKYNDIFGETKQKTVVFTFFLRKFCTFAANF